MDIDKENLSRTFGRSFIETIETFVEESERLDVVYGCLTTMFDAMGQEGRSLVLRKIFMHFLRKFPTDFDNLNAADEYIRKTLNLWKLFGRCSKTMGTVAILEKIEDSYADCYQYYQILAESMTEEGRTDTDDLYKIFRKCVEHCGLSTDQVSKIFGPQIMQYIKFSELDEEDDCTAQFMHIVRQNDIRKSLAARRRSSVAPSKLDIVFEKTDENVTSSEIGRLSIKDSGQLYSAQSVQRKCALQPLMPIQQTPTIFSQHPQPIKVSYYVDRTEIQETIPATGYSQEVTIQKSPKDDFTVFKDPTIALKMAHLTSVPLSPATHSPSPKRGRINLHHELEKKAGWYGKENKHSFCQDSPTICGNHMKPNNNHSFSILTSTPGHERQPAKLFQNDQSTLKFDDEHIIPSPDPLELEKKRIAEARRKTIGLFDKSPDFRPQSAASAHATQHKSTNLDNLVFEGVLNPWDEEERRNLLSTSKFIQQYNWFPAEGCPQINKSHPFTLGNKTFIPLKQIGEGGFARVFKCKVDHRVVALKYQRPGCPFEVHIVDTIQSILPVQLKPFVMSISDAFIYKDATAIVYEYLPYKTVLELSNAYRIQGNEIYGGVISIIGFQLGRILRRIHEGNIIHGDLKPDNILVCSQLPDDRPMSELLDFPLIRLIDFGRAIDMKYFKGKNFTGKVKTQCFMCQEMKEDRPWTFQTDFFGYVATIYTLINHRYMETKTEAGRVKPKMGIKQRMVTGSIWIEIFDKFLNIPSCSSMPQWEPILRKLKQELVSLQESDAPSLKNAIFKLNKMIQINHERN